jgi:hypothetical protein
VVFVVEVRPLVEESEAGVLHSNLEVDLVVEEDEAVEGVDTVIGTR